MPRSNKGPHLWQPRRGGRWLIRWFDAGQRRTDPTGTRDRGEAEGCLARFILARQTPGHVSGPRDPSQRAVADVLAAYAGERAPTVAYPNAILFAVDRLLDFWGGLTVADVTEQTCRGYADQRRTGAAGRRPVTTGTAGNELIVLASAINHDWRRGRLTRTVAVWLPQRPKPRERYLTRDEVAQLLRAARRSHWARWHLPLFILLGVYAGARHEAILSLRWPQVDLGHGLIDFNVPGRERTSKGRALVPIPRPLLTFLRIAHARRRSDVGYVVEFHGAPIRSVRKAWKLAREAAGLGPEVTPHILRHTCATWLVQAGVPFPKVARWLGHTKTTHTETVYAQHAPGYLDDARSALERPRKA